MHINFLTKENLLCSPSIAFQRSVKKVHNINSPYGFLEGLRTLFSMNTLTYFSLQLGAWISETTVFPRLQRP